MNITEGEEEEEAETDEEMVKVINCTYEIRSIMAGPNSQGWNPQLALVGFP